MLTRRTLLLGSTACASVGALWWIYDTSEAHGTFEIERSDAEWRSLLTRAQFEVLRLHRTEIPGSSPLNQEKRQGTYRLRRLRPAIVLVGNEIRQPHRLAELLPAACERAWQQARLCSDDPAHRGALPSLRWTSRTCLRGRPAADRPALLHQRHCDEVLARRRNVGRVRASARVPCAPYPERPGRACAAGRNRRGFRRHRSACRLPSASRPGH